MRSLGIVLAIALVAGCTAAANADLLAFWHFNNATNVGTNLWQINPFGTTAAPTDYPSDGGTLPGAELSAWGTGTPKGNLSGSNGGSASNNWGGYAGTTMNWPAEVSGSAAGDSLAILGPNNNNKSWLIELDTSALDNVVLTYATEGTGTGANTHKWEYSTDYGATWTVMSSHAAQQTTTWVVHTVSFDGVFASTAGLDRNLIRCTVSGATGTNGNNRFDNVVVRGDIVPEPATLVLLALGGLALIRRK